MVWSPSTELSVAMFNRRHGLPLLIVGMVTLVVASLLLTADTEVPELELSEAAGPPGTTVSVRGTHFSPDNGAQEVEIRWDDADGKKLAVAEPDDAGSFAITVSIPEEAEAGYYMLVASQIMLDEDGEKRPVVGTPARASFRVAGS